MTDLYLEAKSGIAGDMVVAALLDLGADEEKMKHALDSLKIDGLTAEVTNVVKNGIRAKDFSVKMHGHTDQTEHADKHHHAHEHRHLSDIFTLIDSGALTETAKKLAKKIFTVVAQAESTVHGEPVEHVHFHEVGAWDSIADIVATAVCFDDLNIDDVYVSTLSEGNGFVDCAHGRLPVPVPATAEIATVYDMEICLTDTPFEMVTPTGIAIAAALRTQKGLPTGKIVKTGYGAGKRDTKQANVLRAFLMQTKASADTVWVVETNIDDSTGEQLGFALETLMKKGAFDAHFMPCLMKKGRPAWLLRVIVPESRLQDIEQTVFETTTTVGVRRFRVERTCMDRETIETVLPFGTVTVKKCTLNGLTRFYPEYESVRAAALASGTDFSTVFDAAKRQAQNG